ncbi:helix-turn-helix domain-containing protein [Brevibacillus brevis]|uniref:helix-turn-helix domain-containing protein n=1 Tax=Brevibacillus brevis TaxID=1393 RepID=UPI000D0FD595|nr:helix-turn-helix transcriptional regulator [Brevibacillus brevis]PSJ66650.1 XRE family transcriptional regulator [Brevibacillus brevis]RED21060.1 DNA-binding XRE family transcriptional regulator [Brevibacillus brevis]GEC92687.1 hypothetical protein BBR01nite_50180 [Brevibacillus brevis]VEF86604.1 Helix-turn-helix domain [Brevibacillus brevis]
MKSFGDKVKELRIGRRLSQDELAEKLNERFGSAINKSMISKWENNLSEPKLETARMIALFFNESLDDLLSLNNDIQTIAAHHDGEDWTDEELKEIERFKEFVKLKRKQQE